MRIVEDVEGAAHRWELVFDEDGRFTAPDRDTFLRELAASGVEDLFVFSHGWNNDQEAARELYDDMFPRISEASSNIDTLGRVGFAGVLWPSMWFPETPAYVPPPAGSAEADSGGEYDETSGSDTLTGSAIAESLLPGFADESDREVISEIGRLIDQGVAAAAAGPADGLTEAEQEQLILRIHELATSLAPAFDDTPEEDSGESSLFSSAVPAEVYEGVADTFGSAPPEDSTQGSGDWFRKAVEGAKDMVRILSYTIMKARAGTVGRVGLGPLLTEIPAKAPGVRVHLIGHSFGARLVSFALSTVGEPDSSPVNSLLLIQGAFSHFSFSHAEDNPFGKPGALHPYADRVHGPLVSTYSVFDYAVGRWYPKASFLSGQDTEDEDLGRWDGMGADGFRAVHPLKCRSLQPTGGTDFSFSPGTFYRVDAAWVIDDVDQSAFSGAHSDIRNAPVAQLAAATAGAHA
jgi:hypothetical protein